MEQKFSGLQKAIQRVGDLSSFARAIGATDTLVMKWLGQDGTAAPVENKRWDTGIGRAVKIAGGPAKMARDLNMSHQSIAAWLKQGYAPLKHVPQIEMQTGVPRAELVSPKVRNSMGVGGEL